MYICICIYICIFICTFDTRLSHTPGIVNILRRRTYRGRIHLLLHSSDYMHGHPPMGGHVRGGQAEWGHTPATAGREDGEEEGGAARRNDGGGRQGEEEGEGRRRGLGLEGGEPAGAGGRGGGGGTQIFESSGGKGGGGWKVVDGSFLLVWAMTVTQ